MSAASAALLRTDSPPFPGFQTRFPLTGLEPDLGSMCVLFGSHEDLLFLQAFYCSEALPHSLSNLAPPPPLSHMSPSHLRFKSSGEDDFLI